MALWRTSFLGCKIPKHTFGLFDEWAADEMSLLMTELPLMREHISMAAGRICRIPQLASVRLLKTRGLRWSGVCTISIVNDANMERPMKMRPTAVAYRENCGGMLSNLASGFARTMKNLADIEMYEDLRERIFKKAVNHHSDPSQPFTP